MAEVVGAVAAVTGLIETAIRLLSRLRKAHERQKKLPEVLNGHEEELKSMKAIVEIIDDEDSLQTAAVATELIRLKDVEDKLVKLLRKLDTNSKGTVKQYTHHFIHGSAEEKKLAAIMGELCRVKSGLLLRIQVASVGVMRTVGDMVFANAEAISRVDSFLKEQLGEGRGLKIARLLKGRTPQSDGNVPLTFNELASLNRDDDSEHNTLIDDTSSSASSAGAAKTKAKTVRIVVRNMTKEQALMINAPIGEDLWAHINHLEIKDNKAEDNSLMVNYATSLEVFNSLIDRQQQRRIDAAAERHT